MGVPDFLKFVVRHAPSSLCKVPHEKETDDESVQSVNFASHLCYDYVLIDATNVSQTIGLEKVFTFLTNKFINIKYGVIFALDSERNRISASRFYRQTHLLVSDLAVKINEMCVKLQKHYEERHKLHLSAHAPFVAMSGREVAGEADYKILDIQRGLILASMCTARFAKSAEHEHKTENNLSASQQSSIDALRSQLSSELNAEIPKFLFITEDSDVLCGVMCGPFPQKCSIVTTLHDTLYELSILRVEQVMLYIANCVQVLSAETRQIFKINEVKEAKHNNQIVNLSQNYTNDRDNCTEHNSENKLSGKRNISVSAGTLTTTSTTTSNSNNYNNHNNSNSCNVVESKDVDIVRRRKVDGPMIATGIRVEFADSESDSDECYCKDVDINDDINNNSNNNNNNINIDRSMTDKSNVSGNKQLRLTSEPAYNRDKAKITNYGDEQDNCKKNTQVVPGTTSSCAMIFASLTPYERAVGQIIHSSCVDLVFLFVLVMGDGVRVPPLMPGVTKIDIGSCWKVYCDNKYTNLHNEMESTYGRCLITLYNTTSIENNVNENNKNNSNNKMRYTQESSPSGTQENVTVTVDCHFLHEILSQVHYADVQPRAMSEEEEHRAAVYLSHAVYSVFHYTVACNVESVNKLRHSFLDMRHLMEVNLQAPSLTAVLQLLTRQPRQMYSFALHGVPSRLESHLVDTNGNNHHATVKDKVDVKSSCNNINNYTRELKLDVRDNLCAPLTTIPLRQRCITESAIRGSVHPSHSRMCTLNDFIYGCGSNIHSSKGEIHKRLLSIEQQIFKIAKELSDNKVAHIPMHPLNDHHRNDINCCDNLLYNHMQLLWSFSVSVATDALWAAIHGSKVNNTTGKIKVNNHNCNVVNDVLCDSNDCTNGKLSNYTNVDSITKKNTNKLDTEIDCTKYVYSFELRRMVPIYVANRNNISSSSINKTSDMIDCEERSSITENSDGVHSIRNREDTIKTVKSGAQDVLLQALGVSLDYAKQSNVESKETVSTKRQRTNSDIDLTLKNSKKNKKGNKEQSKKIDFAITKNAGEQYSAIHADFDQRKSPNLATSPPKLSSSVSQSSELNENGLSRLFDGDKTTKREEQKKNDSNNLARTELVNEQKEKSKKTHYRPGKRERRLLRQNTSNTNKEEKEHTK